MKLLGTDLRLKQALQEWAQIAPTLGLDPSAFKAKLIWQKDERTRSHIVVRLKGPRKLILKRIFVAPDDDNLTDGVAAQRRAFARLERHDQAHAPDVFFAAPDGRTVVMVEASGKTLNDHLRAGRPHDQMLRRAGAWLDAFHRSGGTEARTYQPRFMVNHVGRMRKATLNEAMRVTLPELFVACCAHIPTVAQACEGQPTISATKHGDLNLRNLMLGPDGETGLDFKPVSSAPVGFDIARLLMDYAELFQPDSNSLVSNETLDAFFDGYRLVDRNDPSVRFVPYVQLLNDWRLIPPNPAKRSWRQTARMERIEALARSAFDLK